MPDGQATNLGHAITPHLPIDGNGRRRCAVASAAVVGFAAVLVLYVHRPMTPVRGHGPVISVCHSMITWTALPPGNAASLSQTSHAAPHGTFWVGVLSLASGVAIIRLATLLRTVRIGSRCGH